MRRVPDIPIPSSDDPHELRSRLLEARAKIHSYANNAEQACYEVERRWRTEVVKISPKKGRNEGSAIISHGKSGAASTPPRQGKLHYYFHF